MFVTELGASRGSSSREAPTSAAYWILAAASQRGATLDLPLEGYIIPSLLMRLYRTTSGKEQRVHSV